MQTSTTEIAVAAILEAFDRRNLDDLYTASVIADTAPSVDRGHVFRSVGMWRRDDLTCEQAARLIVEGQAPLGVGVIGERVP